MEKVIAFTITTKRVFRNKFNQGGKRLELQNDKNVSPIKVDTNKWKDLLNLWIVVF